MSCHPEYWEQDPSGDKVVLNSQSQSQSHLRRPQPKGRRAARGSGSPSPPSAPAAPTKFGTRLAQHRISSDDDDIGFVPTQRAKAKSKAKAPTRTKVVTEYYPEPEDAVSEEEVVRFPRRKTRGRSAVVVENDTEDFGAAMAAIPDLDDSVDDNTLKSSGDGRSARNAGTRQTDTTSVSTRRSARVVSPPTDQIPVTSRTGVRKRGRADSDSDDGISFKGFAASNKRSKR